jgi:hypothetical protein
VIVQRLREGDRISAVAMVDASVEIEGVEGEPLPLGELDGELDGAGPAAHDAVTPEAVEDGDGDAAEDAGEDEADAAAGGEDEADAGDEDEL